MNQFLVPQFIEVEPKIFGPITVRQFIIMIVAVVIIAIEYKLLTFVTFIASGLVTFVLFGVVAFVKINGQPFHYFLLNLIQTLKRPRLKIWRKEITLEEIKKLLTAGAGTEIKPEVIPRKKLFASSHLEELSLVVNTGGAYEPTEEDFKYEESKK